jgi:hypothetical protein
MRLLRVPAVWHDSGRLGRLRAGATTPSEATPVEVIDLSVAAIPDRRNPQGQTFFCVLPAFVVHTAIVKEIRDTNDELANAFELEKPHEIQCNQRPR